MLQFGLQETQILALTSSDLKHLPSFSGPVSPWDSSGRVVFLPYHDGSGCDGRGSSAPGSPAPHPPSLLPAGCLPGAPRPPPGPYLCCGPRRAGRPRSRARRWGRREPDGALGCPGGRGSPASGRPGGPRGRGWRGPRGAAAAAAAARAAGAVPGGGAPWCPASGRRSLARSRAGAADLKVPRPGPAPPRPGPRAWEPRPGPQGPASRIPAARCPDPARPRPAPWLGGLHRRPLARRGLAGAAARPTLHSCSSPYPARPPGRLWPVPRVPARWARLCPPNPSSSARRKVSSCASHYIPFPSQ